VIEKYGDVVVEYRFSATTYRSGKAMKIGGGEKGKKKKRKRKN
jgi:hypothetical protein